MSLFISEAWAQQAAPAGQQPDMIAGLLPFIVLFVVFYFLLVRPQQKRVKEHKKMVEALAKGDEVATQGGLVGKITAIGENFVEVEVSENVRVKVQRGLIASILPKGTIKSL